jgi:glutathione peroxidase
MPLNAMSMFSLVFALAAAPAPSPAAKSGSPMSSSISSLSLRGLSGQALPADALAGKVVLFVNVASKCGYTPQYKGLQALYEANKDAGLVIVGVPCNQFGAQEPGTPEQIEGFCQLNYGVNFPLLEKQDVNGAGRSALYGALVGSAAGGGADVKWNFEKFLVGRDGAVLARFPSSVAPDSPELKAAIQAAL